MRTMSEAEQGPAEPGRTGHDTGGQLDRRGFLRATGAALAVSGVLAGCSQSSAPTPVASSRPRRGGRLRVADPGGGSTETLDPQKSLNLIDEMRDRQLYDTLLWFTPDLKLIPWLATSVEPNAKADQFQLKLRPGVTFSNGKPLTADDVLYTWKRILNPATASPGAIAIANLDLARTSAVGKHEIIATLHRPQVDFPILLTGREQSIIPQGLTDFSAPVGTGPFQYVSFNVGQQSLFRRNPNYWVSGQPYVDELQITSIPSETARVNALQGGVVDAADNIPYIDARTLKGSSAIRPLTTKSVSCIPFYVQLDVKPFDDPRVVEALKLAINRPPAVEAAFLGFGEVGNDIFGLGTPQYDASIPQHRYDPEKSKYLLKQAGETSVPIVINTNPSTSGNVESSEAWVPQAKAAGFDLTVKVWDAATFGSKIYNHVPCAQTYWNYPLPIMFVEALAKGSAYNETHFDNPTFNRLYQQAEATLDLTKRQELYGELQQILWSQGGYVIWGFLDFPDAISSRVHGFMPSRYFNLGAFQFRTWWLA
jgi:peptide/nickel transport system substrate-binding protein